MISFTVMGFQFCLEMRLRQKLIDKNDIFQIDVFARYYVLICMLDRPIMRSTLEHYAPQLFHVN